MHRRSVLRLVGAGTLATGPGCLASVDLERGPELPGEFLTIAHRGGHLARPENTLPAFAHAIEVGANVVEMDLLTTLEGEIVVIHDETVQRTTDGSGRVDEMTLAELKELDAGYAFTEDGETFPYRGQGIEIPTLQEVLEAVPEGWFLLEPKQREVDVVALFDLLEEFDALDRTVVGAFETETLTEVRAIAPDVATGLGVREFIKFNSIARADELRFRPAAEIAFVPYGLVTRRLIERTHRYEMALVAWTVHDRPDMRTLVDLGVDGILTPDPNTLLGVLETGGDGG